MTKAEVFQAPTPLEHSAMLDRILEGRVPTHSEAMSLSNVRDLKALTKAATNKRDAAHGHVISYSRKVFIPLTKCAAMSAIIAHLLIRLEKNSPST